MKRGRVGFATAMAIVTLVGCDAFDRVQEAAELAETSAYYAQLGVRLDPLEQEFGNSVPQLSAAATEPSAREGALASVDSLLARMDQAVQQSAPSEGDSHPGYRAARRMIDERRNAVTALRQAWAGQTDPEQSANALTTFTNEWMMARSRFMSAVGQHSQQVFGPAAQRSYEGATGAQPQPK